MIASRHPGGKRWQPYERLLGDAMAGDATEFARQDYVEEAWRIVDPMLKADTPVYIYDPGTWGPAEAAKLSPPRAAGRIPKLPIRRSSTPGKQLRSMPRGGAMQSRNP